MTSIRYKRQSHLLRCLVLRTKGVALLAAVLGGGRGKGEGEAGRERALGGMLWMAFESY